MYGYGIGYGVKPNTAALSSAFSPLLLPNLKLWLDATDTDTITKDGGDLVSNWADKSGLGNDAAQITATNQPLWTSGVYGTNSKDAIDFDGIDNFLDLGTVLSKFPNHTLFIALKYDTTNQQQAIAERQTGGAAATAGIGLLHTGGKLQNWFGNGSSYRITAGSTTITTATEYLFNNTFTSGDTLTVQRLNGADETETNGGGAATTITGTKYKMSIGQSGDNAAQRLNGTVAEVIICDAVLSTDDIALTEAYINAKYGIY